MYERRYKNVFHFRYATKEATGSNRDDFVKANDPFLAFAARCTSSFPFAFEAMCLSDIRAVTSGYRKYENNPLTNLETKDRWDSFFTSMSGRTYRLGQLRPAGRTRRSASSGHG